MRRSFLCICPVTHLPDPVPSASYRTALSALADPGRRTTVVNAVEYTYVEATVSRQPSVTYTLPGGTTGRVFGERATALACEVGLLARMAS